MMDDPKLTARDILCDFVDFLLGRKKFFLPVQQERYLCLVFALADKLEWMFGYEDDGKVGVNFNTTMNLLPSIDGLLGPQSHGSDLSFGEYRKAVEFYNKYTIDHNSEALSALVGILYRHPSKAKIDAMFDGNYREPFNENIIHVYIDHATHLPEYLKYGVYLWFSHFCSYIVDGGDFTIEGNELCFSPIFDSTPTDEDAPVENSIGMLAVLFTLADSGTFGNAQETNKTNLFKVLLKLLHDKQTADNLKRK